MSKASAFYLHTISAIALAAGCAPINTTPGSEVARTWEQGRVYLPHNSSYFRPSEVSVRDPRPTVVYLHGCTGITVGDQFWAGTLTEAGYAMVMPDSFARYHRLRNCDPRRYGTGLFPEAGRMRQEEIEHALAMVRSSPWADQKNLFLMGHSEGGAAVARWQGYSFKALIISGHWCRAGVRAPLKTPIVAINFESDPWSSGLSATCASRFQIRENATELLLSGSGHDTSRSPEAQNAVMKFLLAQTTR